jgi:RNA polymerase sigma-32 factor
MVVLTDSSPEIEMQRVSIRKDENIDIYMAQSSHYPVFNREEESAIARAFVASRDPKFAQRLVTSNLRFVVKIAHEYRGYGLDLHDLIQEGNIGLMTAVQKFDPERGYRLISYAVWWVRALIQNYVLRSWSLVKLGTTQAQRKLFFKLRSARQQAEKEQGPASEPGAEELAKLFGVTSKDITDMELRLAARDYSLNAPVNSDGAATTHLELLPSHSDSVEEIVSERDERQFVRRTVADRMNTLNEKERYIIENRLMTDEPQTLQSIGSRFGISRERARQIESAVLRKLQGAFAESGRTSLAAA